jgi:hypothetical protein
MSELAESDYEKNRADLEDYGGPNYDMDIPDNNDESSISLS